MAINPSITDTDRIADYTPGSPTTDFVIGWPVYFTDGEDPRDDLGVMVDGGVLESADFTFTGTVISGLTGVYNGGTVTLDDSVNGSRVIIWSHRDPRRVGYYLEGKSLPFTELDKLMNDFAVQMRDMDLRVRRAVTIDLEDYLDGEDADGFASRIVQAGQDAIAAAAVAGSDLWSRPALDTLSATPVSPAVGDRYLVAASGASGAFSGHQDQVAQWTSTAWVFSGEPDEGQTLSVGGIPYTFTDSAWGPEAQQPGTNSVARTYRGKFRDAIHIFDWIAPDLQAEIRAGTYADSLTTQFNNATADILANSPRGESLLIPGGVFPMAMGSSYGWDIDLNGGAGSNRQFRIIGAGRDATVFRSLQLGTSTKPLIRVRGGTPITDAFHFEGFAIESDPASPEVGGGQNPGGYAIQIEDSSGTVVENVRVYRMERGVFLYNNAAGRYCELTRLRNVITQNCYEHLVFDKNLGDPSFNHTVIEMDMDIKDGQSGVVGNNGANIYHADIAAKMWSNGTTNPIKLTGASLVQLSRAFVALETQSGTATLVASDDSIWHTNGWFVSQGTASNPAIPATTVTDDFGFGVETLPSFMFDRNVPLIGKQTFTPVLKFNGDATGITYSSGRQTGFWRLDGDVVHAVIDMALTSKGAVTGAVTVGSLPFVAADILNPTISCYVRQGNMSSDIVGPQASIAQDSNTLSILVNGSTAAADTNFSDTSLLQIGISYLRKYG